MVIKLYISGISGNKEVKKKQQRVQMILDSKQISYEAIDITEPGKEKDKEFMQQNGKVRESLGKYPLPPQIFNDDDFCGDYEDFDMANEVDELEKFLHIATNSKDLDNDSKEKEGSKHLIGENSIKNVPYDPYDYHVYKIKWDEVNGLQEEIISTDISAGAIDQTEAVTKSEVNGETEAGASSKPSTDDTGVVTPEVATEVSNPINEGEESSVNENPQESTGGDVEDNQKNEEQVEEEGEEKLDEDAKEEKTEENAEEKSPESKEEEKDEEEEEEKEDEDEEEKEEESKENLDIESKKENENEKEEESENESASEKSEE